MDATWLKNDTQKFSALQTIFGVPKYAPKMHFWPYLAYLGAYLSSPNMVKWGVPEFIYGSIMLKIFVCHFLTKLHPFFTYEGGKKIGPTYC